MLSKNSLTWRLLEILPGLTTWVALLVPVVLSFRVPWLVAIFVLIFDLYWLLRSIRMVVNTIRTYRYMRHDRHVAWHEILQSDIPTEENGIKLVSENIHPKDLYHVIILVHYKEPVELLLNSIESYAASHTDKQRLWLVLASEERAGQETVGEVYRQVKAKYGRVFGRIIQTIHPAHISGEIKCKSANGTWAAKALRQELDAKKITYNHVIVHNFDADTRVYANYFDCVAYKYLTSPQNQPVSFQPVHTYTNNIWDVPALMRLCAQSSTLVFMHNMLRPVRFHHFSSRSDVFQTIVDINYWTVSAIPEDSRQYYDSYFYYGGKLKIIPIYIPLRMDAVLADTYWGSVVNQYRQLRRWAWGVSDLPYVVSRAMSDRGISWWNKSNKILRLCESHFSWATSAIYIACLGWLPVTLNTEFTQTVLGYNFPFFARYILSLALIGLLAGIIISYLLLPPRPKHRSPWFYLNFFWQWILSPIASIFLSSLAAIDAQTRLMLGKRLDYQVTEKAVAKTD
jgi:hypothetical protein